MIRIILVVIIILSTNASAMAQWHRYWEDKRVTAAYKSGSFAPFHNQPSVWVRWHNRSPAGEYGGELIQFSADCNRHRLFEIATIPYDRQGNYLAEQKHYDAPLEYPLNRGTLNGATYRLLCR